MSPQKLTELTIRDAPTLRHDEPLGPAVQKLLDRDVPALPVVGPDGRYAGIFGEREFLKALFPGYVGELRSASFLRHSMDDVLERRTECREEQVSKYMLTEHVDVDPDVSDLHVTEIFLHHHVLVVPVVENGVVKGLILRRDFFRLCAERLLAG